MKIIDFLRKLAKIQIDENGYVKAILVVDSKGNPRGFVVTEGFEADRFIPSAAVPDSGKLP